MHQTVAQELFHPLVIFLFVFCSKNSERIGYKTLVISKFNAMRWLLGRHNLCPPICKQPQFLVIPSKQSKVEDSVTRISGKIQKTILFLQLKNKDHAAYLLSYRHFAVLGAVAEH